MNKSICSLLGAIFLVACGERGSQVEKVIENGVEVVLNHLEPYKIPGQPSTFSLEKVLSVDLEREDLAAAGLGSVGEWDADDRGNIYVVGFKNGEDFIYRFDSTGRLSGSFGRRGQGPGELQWPFLGGVSATGEVILADRMQKFIVYDGNGALLREVRFRRPALHIDPLPNGKSLTFGFRPEFSSGGSFVDGSVLCGGETVKPILSSAVISTCGSWPSAGALRSFRRPSSLSGFSPPPTKLLSIRNIYPTGDAQNLKASVAAGPVRSPSVNFSCRTPETRR